MKRQDAGFTLVELLISMLLIAIVLGAIVSINIGTSKSLAVLQTRNDLLPEVQIAQNYLATKIREATYIFPQTISITLGSDYTTRNPRTGTGFWDFSKDPIIAFISPPRKDDGTTLCAPTSLIINTDYCYTFYAYYPVKRSVVTGTATGVDNPGGDVANDPTAWVLMEYRAPYAQSGYPANNSFPTTGRGRIVMDYLLPTTQTTSDYLFTQTTNTTTAGMTSVTVNLAGLRSMASSAVRVPATGRFTLTVFPRNIGAASIGN